MIPSAFAYHAPTSIEQALELLATHSDDAKLLAGGHSLLPMMKLRFAEPDHLIDINGIDELRGIRLDGDTIRIGAMTTEAALLDSDLLKTHCPLLPAAVRNISDPQVRNCGTIGGSTSGHFKGIRAHMSRCPRSGCRSRRPTPWPVAS